MNDVAGGVVSKPPTSFWIVAVLLLLWMLAGCAAYLGQVTTDVSTLDAETRAMYEATPLWAAAVFAIAVWVGLLAAILLLLKRRQARLFFVVSLLAAIAQFAYFLLFSDVVEFVGAQAVVFPLLVIVIGAFAVWYARRAATLGWIR